MEAAPWARAVDASDAKIRHDDMFDERVVSESDSECRLSLRTNGEQHERMNHGFIERACWFRFMLGLL